MNKVEIVNVNEFAASLGVTSACVRRWILERRIASVKVGRLVKIPQSEIERIITAGLRPARPAKSAAGRGIW